LASQDLLGRAVAAGADAATLRPLVQAQAEAVDRAVRAARQRVRELPDAPAVERWVESDPQRASQRRDLVQQGRGLRRQLEEAAQRGTYLARRVALWNESQRAWIVEAVMRESRAEGYGGRPAGGLAAALDRTV
jgi:hypothetical protein